jgi:hypothetical protein
MIERLDRRIVSYRIRRHGELLALRDSIDALAQEIATSGFNEAIQSVKFDRFKRCIQEHSKAIQEQNFSKILSGVEIKFNWDRFFPLAIPASTASVYDFQLALGAFIGAAVSSIEVSSAIGLKKKNEIPTAFEYIFRAAKEI